MTQPAPQFDPAALLAADPAGGGAGSSCDLLVVGCGNLLRGDDGVGPILVRHLWQGGVPAGVRLVDGGTAGMDVSFQMRGAKRVVLVDAAASGAAPGTVYRVPGPAVEDLPPLQGLHTHSFRWDHALAFARWLLGDGYPEDVTVYLIEVAQVDPGADLSEPVATAMQQVLGHIREEPAFRAHVRVELTEDGYLRLAAADAARLFPGDAVVVRVDGGELLVVPLRGTLAGGLVLKQRNAAGDRCVLVREVLEDRIPLGVTAGRWDDRAKALRIPLTPSVGAGQ